MTTSFKSRFLQLSKWLIALFAIMFVFRIIYGYFSYSQNTVDGYSENFFSSIDNLRKNYASEKIVHKGDAQAVSNMASHQKFEKTATIKTKSSEFEKDEKHLKELTKDFRAVIQYEQHEGQKGNRQIHLLIGINPILFDSFYVALQKIGHIKSTSITKVDKTNEYRQLNAKKTSLEKTLKSLNELKSNGGAISDFISLNDKILEIEEKLQDLGVELGNFDTENEFCTIKLSINEGATEKNISFLHRSKVALEWTIKYYTFMMFGLMCMSILSFLLLLLIDKLNIIKLIIKKIGE